MKYLFILFILLISIIITPYIFFKFKNLCTIFKYPKTTNKKRASVVEIKIGEKKLYESRFENFSKKEAYNACKRLKKYKRDCFVRL